MRSTKLAFCLVVTVLLSLPLAQTQEAKPLARHPGDVIKYEIKFDGPNSEKVKNINASLTMRVQPPKDQAGFANNFQTNSVPPSSPKTFDVELKVPDNAATGDYYLYIAAVATEGHANYADGETFNTPAIRIENPKTFTPPSITVKPLP